MKGWVYVISNTAMPDLIKIGYSNKDPQLRARELDHTGSPAPYVVDYEMHTSEPRFIEQKVHTALSQYNVGKEWFRCSTEEAIVIIQKIAGNRKIYECFKRADRQKAERLGREREEKAARSAAIRAHKKEIEDRMVETEKKIREKFDALLKERFSLAF